MKKNIENIQLFLKEKESSAPPYGLVSIALTLGLFAYLCGLNFNLILLLSIVQFVLSVWILIKTYNKKLKDKDRNFYSGVYGVSLSFYAQLLLFFINIKRIGIKAFSISLLVLILNIVIIFALFLYVRKKAFCNSVSMTSIVLTVPSSLGAVLGIVFMRQFHGNIILLSNIVYFLASIIFSVFSTCLFKFWLYLLIERQLEHTRDRSFNST